MRTNHVIHHTDLDAMIGELRPAHVVRVVALDRTLSTAASPLRIAQIAAHARAIGDGGEIHSCCLLVEELQVFDNSRNDPARQKYEAAWIRANALAEELREHLQRCGLDVRGGIIEMGEASPVYAAWGSRAAPACSGGSRGAEAST